MSDHSAVASEIFYLRIRGSLFGGHLRQSQVDGIGRIGGVCARAELSIEQTAYVLATVYHETGQRMQPVRETFADSDEQAIARLDRAWANGQLRWVKWPYWRPDSNGRSWFGRGDVQLTHENNYAHQQNKLAYHPLRPTLVPYAVHDDPSMALDPQTSALICVLGMRDGDYTGKRLCDYIEGSKADYLHARRIVNSMDRAADIAGYARAFESAIRCGSA
jgi:hypothetical protein